MPEGRPAIPMEIQRAVLVEAGHRCAIPTCRHPRTEFAHIVPWETVREHRFENIIALCPSCHDRYDNTKEIDRKSMLAYKANLAVLTSRYSEIERRVLELLGKAPPNSAVRVAGGLDIFFMYAINDGILMMVPTPNSVFQMGDVPAEVGLALTPAGRELAQKMFGGEAID